MAAVLVDHLRGEIVMGGCDWIWEGRGFDDIAVLEIEVAELGFKGGARLLAGLSLGFFWV